MKKYGSGIAALFRNFFAPTEQNGMLPFGLGWTAFLLYLGVALVLVLAPVYVRIRNLADLSSPTLANFDASKVISLVNQSRIGAGMSALSENAELDKAADDKVLNMLANQYFAHISPAGVTPWDFFRLEGYNFVAAGENLAKDFTNAGDAQSAFMNSPTHRANILSPLYTEVGAAVEAGTFDGRSTILVAQYFGAPRAAVPVATQNPPPAKVQVAQAAPKNTDSAATSGTAVLGAEIQPAPKPTAAVVPAAPSASTPAVAAQFAIPAAAPLKSIVATPQNGAKTVAIVALFLLLVSSAFLIMRGSPSRIVILRTLVLIAIFGYVAAFGAGTTPVSSITQNSASIIIVSQ